MDIGWLLSRFEDNSSNTAIIWRDKEYTYKDILNRIEDFKEVLKNFGISEGDSVSIEGDYSPSICALMLSLIINNNIIVPLSSASSHNVEVFLDLANVEQRFIFDVQDEFRVIPHQQRRKEHLIDQLRDSNDSGLVLFSSGSTGKSKGIVHSFGRLLTNYIKPRKPFKTLIFLLMDHIGGVNTMFYLLSNGGTMVVESSKLPHDVCKTISKYKVELLPTSPTFLNILLISEAYKDYDMSSLKLITYGTEPMPAFTLKKASSIFSNVTLKQTYGLSEIGIMGTKSEGSDSLYTKLGGEGYEVEVREGILWVKANSSMLGYLNYPSPFDDKGWFCTGDLVEIKGDYFKILGRQSELINVGGEKVYPEEIENVILGIENIKDVVVSGEPNPIMGNIVKARVNLLVDEDILEVKRRVKRECQAYLEKYKIPVIIEVTDLPLHNQRYKRMRNW